MGRWGRGGRPRPEKRPPPPGRRGPRSFPPPPSRARQRGGVRPAGPPLRRRWEALPTAAAFRPLARTTLKQQRASIPIIERDLPRFNGVTYVPNDRVYGDPFCQKDHSPHCRRQDGQKPSKAPCSMGPTEMTIAV